jgi:hypothetical protein
MDLVRNKTLNAQQSMVMVNKAVKFVVRNKTLTAQQHIMVNKAVKFVVHNLLVLCLTQDYMLNVLY